MQIIRDDEMAGIMMIPLFHQYGIKRCNIIECKDKPTTICLHEKATFAICEKHYLDCKAKGIVNLKLEFD
ncbi:MAG: hypothetical protein ABIP68_09650 [Ferruginibacter sp.]